MPKVKLNPFITEIHGKIGDLVFRSTPSGETIVYKAPKKSRGNTRGAQKVQQYRMTAAHTYARAAMADPEMKAFYEQEGQKHRRSAYHMALSNYFKVQAKLGE
jgi:hypothetical protein